MSNFLTIKQASKMLGVTPLTLRNWDKSGKLKASRNPMSNYRLYRREDIEKIVNDIESGTVAPRPPRPKKSSTKKLMVKHLED